MQASKDAPKKGNVFVRVKRRADEHPLGELVIGKRRRIDAAGSGIDALTAQMKDMLRNENDTEGFRTFKRVMTTSEQGKPMEIPQKRAEKRKRPEEDPTPSYGAPRVSKRGRHTIIEIDTNQAELRKKNPPKPKIEVPPGYEHLMQSAYPELMAQHTAEGEAEKDRGQYVIDTYMVSSRTVFASEVKGEAEVAPVDTHTFEVEFDVEALLDGLETKNETWRGDGDSEDTEDETHPRFDYPDEIEFSDDSEEEKEEDLFEDENETENHNGYRLDPIQGEDDLIADFVNGCDYDDSSPWQGLEEMNQFADPLLRRYAPEAFDPDKPLSDYMEDEEAGAHHVGDSEEEEDMD